MSMWLRRFRQLLLIESCRRLRTAIDDPEHYWPERAWVDSVLAEQMRKECQGKTRLGVKVVCSDKEPIRDPRFVCILDSVEVYEDKSLAPCQVRWE